MEKNFRAHLETTNYYSVRVVLLILYTATERSLDTSAVVETNKPLTSCTNACRWNTQFAAAVSALVSLYEVLISGVANQDDIACK